jgi:hypothetical protein
LIHSSFFFLTPVDSVLVTKNAATGQQVSQSMKCADLDKEIPELMGTRACLMRAWLLVVVV